MADVQPNPNPVPTPATAGVPTPATTPTPPVAGSAVAATGYVTLGTGEQVQLASAGARLGARILDFIIVWVGALTLSFLGLVGGSSSSSSSGVVAWLLGTTIAVMVASLAYEVVMTALKGQTVGKMLVGIKVAKAVNGELPGWGPAIGRWAVPMLLAFIPFVGWLITLVTYLSVTFTDTRQGWHDKVAATVVVKA